MVLIGADTVGVGFRSTDVITLEWLAAFGPAALSRSHRDLGGQLPGGRTYGAMGSVGNLLGWADAR